jgi:hypothetical protein
METMNELISYVGLEYFYEEIQYKSDIDLYLNQEYPHTNSILNISNEFD